MFGHEPMFRDDALCNLKLYRYSALDQSLLVKYVLRHYWDFAVTLFPARMAPNLITLSGFVFILLNVCTILVFLPDLAGPASDWVYYSFAMGLFLYQTFDNVDGRQARRTGTSSALGHIFDHTIDSLNTPLSALLQVSSLGLGHSITGFFVIMIGIWGFWLSTWEEYYTKTLYLGYINGPDDGIILACCLQIITGMFGPGVWRQPLGGRFFYVDGIQIVDILVAFAWFAFIVIHSPACFYNVYTVYRRDRTFSLTQALLQNVPFIIYNLLILSWVLSPHSRILSDGSNGNGALAEFALLLAFTFGKLGPRVILARLTKSLFPWFNVGAFAPLLVGSLLVNIPLAQSYLDKYKAIEIWYLHMALIWAASDFTFWFIKLCQGFCRVLSIDCLIIPEKRTV